jgi:hypothetical protein
VDEAGFGHISISIKNTGPTFEFPLSGFFATVKRLKRYLGEPRGERRLEKAQTTCLIKIAAAY